MKAQECVCLQINEKRKVDPIISPAITYILKEASNAHDISFIFLDFLKKYSSTGDTNVVLEKQLLSEKRIKRHRCSVTSIKLSTQIASFLSKVLNGLLERRPQKNIVKFLVKTVESLQSQDYVDNRRRKLTLLEAKHLLLTSSVKKKENTIGCLPEEISSPIKVVFLLVGLNNSGKSTLVSVLKGQKNPNCKPSMGFRPISLKYNDMITVKIYDLGGGDKIRGIWNNYYHDAHGVIYVVDSACSEEEFCKTTDVAKSTLGHKFLQGKPLLVISNKIDKCESKPIDFIRQKLNLAILEGGMTHILPTSLHPVCGKDCYGGKPDPNIDKALEWLIQKVVSNINELNERIADDSKQVKALRIKNQVSILSFDDNICSIFLM